MVLVAALAQALAVRRSHPSRHHPHQHAGIPVSANSAVKSTKEKAIHNIFGALKRARDKVRKDEQQGLHVLPGKNPTETAVRKQTRRRLLHNLDSNVSEASSDVIQKLDGVFGDDSHPNFVHSHRRHLSREQRAAEKLSQRELTRYEDPSHCGARIRAADLGIRHGPEAAALFKHPAFLQEPEDDEEGYPPSLAYPGVGSEQTLADNGRSTMGKVKGEEPFVTVYKDGFFLLGCHKDSVFHTGDMFGSGKNKYKRQYTNISIATYDSLVLKEKQQPMAPKVCFEFCRTIQGMVYFGLQGNTCYCAPFYEPTIEGVKTSDKCDMVCAGDKNSMCGGKKKASIYEMHLCGDRGQQLVTQSLEAARVLSSYYATALFASELGKQLQASGELLAEVAGLGGDLDSAKYGRMAKVWAGELEQEFMKNHCIDEYNNLLMSYEDSETIAFSNMRKAANLQKADDATNAMIAGIPKVKECNKASTKVVEEGYPPYEDAMDSQNERDMSKLEEKYGTAAVTFAPIPMLVAGKKPPRMSVCSGENLGSPMVVTYAECAQACDQMIHPEVCLGFQFYHMGGKEDGGVMKKPLCYLLKDIKRITNFDCEFVNALTEEYEDDLKEAKKSEEFIQRGADVHALDEPEEEDEDEGPSKIEEPHCGTVEKHLLYSGLTCAELFGADHSIKDTCKDACARQNAALLSATCMVKLSEIVSGMKQPEIETKKRCFGGARNKEISNAEGAEIHFLPFDDQGVVLSGDAEVGTSTILEPIIWTVAEDEEEK